MAADEPESAYQPALDGYPEDEVALVERARQHTPVNRLDPLAVMGGVGVSWLAQVFNMSPQLVRKKLRNAPPVRKHPKWGPLYDVAVAAQYLVEPKQQVADWLASVSPERLHEVLPVRYQSPFWLALSKRMEAMRAAGELWHREDVEEALVDVLSVLREALLSLPAELERRADLTASQYREAQATVHVLMDVMRRRLRQKLAEIQSEPYAARVDDILAAADDMRRRKAGLHDTGASVDEALIEEADRRVRRERRVHKALGRLGLSGGGDA